MTKNLTRLCLALFAMACAGGETTGLPQPQVQFPCDLPTPLPVRQTVAMGGTYSYSYNFASCKSVTVSTNTPGPYNPAKADLPPAGSIDLAVTQNTTATIVAIGSGGKTVTLTIDLTVTFPAPTLSINRIGTPGSLALLGQLAVSFNTASVASCSYSTNWTKSGKEDPATVAPTFNGDLTASKATFSPGSTMPVGRRSVALNISCLGLNNATVTDTITVALEVPKLVVDSMTPRTMQKGCGPLRAYSAAGRFLSSNGVDFRGTIGGFSPDTTALVTNPDQFISPNLIGSGICVGNGHTVNYDRAFYFANVGRPEPPLMFNLRVIIDPNQP